MLEKNTQKHSLQLEDSCSFSLFKQTCLLNLIWWKIPVLIRPLLIQTKLTKHRNLFCVFYMIRTMSWITVLTEHSISQDMCIMVYCYFILSLHPPHETAHHLWFLFQMEFKTCLQWPISPCINSPLARFHATYTIGNTS